MGTNCFKFFINTSLAVSEFILYLQPAASDSRKINKEELPKKINSEELKEKLAELNKKLKEPNKKTAKELQKLQEEHLPKLEKHEKI